MDITQVVYQLRTYCPILKSVAAAGDLSVLNENTNLPLPCAFVVPTSMDARENESLNSTFQIIKQNFSVLVALDNTTDPRGQLTATVDVNAVFYALIKALVGWFIETEPSYRSVYLGEEVKPYGIDRARSWWEFPFSYEIVIDQTWGFTPPSIPLSDINTTLGVTLANVSANAVDLSFDVPLAQ